MTTAKTILAFTFMLTPTLVNAQAAEARGTVDSPMTLGHGVTPPSLIFSVGPNYSGRHDGDKRAWQAVVSFVVDENGMPEKVQAISCSIPDLCAAAAEAVRQYRFRPGMLNGHPVAVSLKSELFLDHF